MSRCYINIGTARNAPDLPALSFDFIHGYLLGTGFEPREVFFKVRAFDIENTVVASVITDGLTPRLSRLCYHLQQDAVAVYKQNSRLTGLYGPKTKEWGDFDQSKFIMPTGQTLLQVRQLLAA